MDGVRLISSEVLGIACESVIIGGKVYVIFPPNIKKICGAGLYLSGIKGNTLAEMLSSLQDIECVCKALSWFIQGDESLTEELMEGTLKEVTEALVKAVSLIGIENFPKLSGLARNVRSLVAISR